MKITYDPPVDADGSLPSFRNCENMLSIAAVQEVSYCRLSVKLVSSGSLPGSVT
jgi:hypothetical protein